MKEYYECHITMTGLPQRIKNSVEECGWIFSKIDGDPDLGKGIKCYATRHFNEKIGKASIITNLKATAQSIKDSSDAKILRKKIELVIFDERE